MLRREGPQPLRLGFYGDSNLTRDFFTSSVRHALQTRYGDAGHGFSALGRPWPWYLHRDVVQHFPSRGWRIWTLSGPRASDLRHGLSGIAAVGELPNARVRLETVPAGSPVGSSVDRASVYFLDRPGGGSFDVLLDGTRIGSVDTDAAKVQVDSRDYHFADGPHRLEIVMTSAKPTRLLGAALERGNSGFIVDSFGIGGAYYYTLALENPATTAEMGALRPHALLAYWLGANTNLSERYDQDVGAILARRRQLHPQQALLIIAPPDIQRKPGDPHSDLSMPLIVRELRKVAKQHNVAFYDLYETMGGRDAMGRFRAAGLAMDDHHLNLRGSELMANRFLAALWNDFQRHLREHPRAGCDPLEAEP